MQTKRELYDAGRAHLAKFLEANPSVAPIRYVEERVKDKFATCAYYRSGVIYIDIPATAAIGVAGMAWSAPGYMVDRTPYGVVAHELGHHVDLAHGNVPGQLSPALRELTKEEPITTYTPNTNEWFAEIFRLFVTNPDLLAMVRPKTYKELRARFEPVETRTWYDVLAPFERQRKAAENKIAKAMKAAARAR